MRSRAPWSALAVLSFVAASVRIAAQDVTVMPLDWLGPHDPGDELPAMKGFAEPKFPTELTKTTQIGWAEIESYVDEKGVLYVKEASGTLPCFAGLAEAAYANVTFDPAHRGGAPIAARLRHVLLFNPASAAPDGPDATPRLLRAKMIIDPARKVVEETLRPEPEVVWVAAHVDVSGRVTEVLAPSPRLTKLILAGMSDWQFAPARRGGAPTETALRLPVILAAPGGLEENVFVPPHILSKVAPTFPFEAARYGVGGAVLLDYVVDTNGIATEIKVRRRSHDVFASAAVSAVKKWKFAPALRDGLPVDRRARQLFTFTLDDSQMDESLRKGSESGGKGVTVKSEGDPSKLPESLRYDTAPKVWQLEHPKYPYALLAKSVRGSAQIAVVIGPDGKIATSKVVRADSPEFGYALQAAVEQFRYEPAIRNGDPTPTIVTVEEKFEIKTAGENLVVSDEERAALKLELKNPEKIAKTTELDAKPRAIHTPAPAYPRSLDEAVDGEAVVEFLVNEDGRALLPRVISASRPEFGYAAVHGVSDWRFEQPTRNGKPVTVRARVPFKFRAPEGYPNEQRVLVP
ncbi:MAG TPA: energy transducer TonB [Opitutaceae bacterium]|nr:energy transducer TonB [Opitutaceae bacterium]